MRSRAVCWVAVAASFALTAGLSGAARATDVPGAHSAKVRVVGECPRAEAVMQALAPLLGSSGQARAAGEPPRVVDLGERYEVTAAGETGQYVDPARDCTERARVAAVFIALSLNPPAIRRKEPSASAQQPPRTALPGPAAPAPPPGSAHAPPPGSAPAPVPASTTASGARAAQAAQEASNRSAAGSRGISRTPRSPFFRIQLGGRLDAAPSVDPPSVSTGGVELRGAVGASRWGVTAGASLLASSVVELNGIRVREQRIPFDLGLRLPVPLTPSELAFDVGATATVLRVRGEGLAIEHGATRVDLGVRGAFEARFEPVGRFAPFLGAHVEYFPRAYSIFVDPRGVIGSTAHFWVGATAGVSFALE